MSVVLVTDRYRTIRRVLDRLRAQTAKAELEIVIVIPTGDRPGDDGITLDDFGTKRILELPSIHPVPIARAAGIRAATAPIVFLGETHSFPHPEFAAKLIAAHDSHECDVVVPGIANANPESVWSWASFLIDYGMWLDALPGGPIAGGPTWNVAYRKASLADIDSRLEAAMEHGDVMAEWFRSARGRAWFEPGARLDHANISVAGRWLEQRYLCGLLVANSRKQRWSRGRRALYVLASPLIAALILYRLRRPVGALVAARALPILVLPTLVLGALVRTMGEVVGYMVGAPSGAQPRMDEYELHKLDFTSIAA
jgi:hypothetical protein